MIQPLKSSYDSGLPEAGCDEAGRGCLAGPVFAAAVILRPGYRNAGLNDSKKLTETQRLKLRAEIEQDATAWAVAMVDNHEIDRVNILNASILAMHKAVEQLKLKPGLLLVDGNRFKPYEDIPHVCIVRGDGQYMSIAAASILAKTYRDEFMVSLGVDFPQYLWYKNKGYPTLEHREAIARHGITIHHRLSFFMQLSLW